MSFVAKVRFSYKSDWEPSLTHEIVNGGKHFHIITEKTRYCLVLVPLLIAHFLSRYSKENSRCLCTLF